MKLSIVLPRIASVIAIAAQVGLTLYASPSLSQPAASAPTHPYAASRPVPGRYIVVFKSTVANSAAATASVMQGNGGRVLHSYTTAIKGFSANLSEAAVLALRSNPIIESIEQDQTVSLTQVASPQNQATWGLDRIDQADRPLDTQYHFSGTGAGVNAFIIDTGIRSDHLEFTGRLLPGYTAVVDGNGTNDCNGHGTHVAGTVGGTTWGVAKGVSLIPVRVLNCAGSGSWSDVIAGIDWVANSALRPAVANLSLGGATSAALDAAVAGAVGKGVTMVVAAGNNNLDACNYSPAREPSAITVGASNSLDSRSYFSNIGVCVDLFAPGENIVSAWYGAADASRIMSGTSMASPHVAGVAALTLASHPTASPGAVAASLMANATPNRLVSVGAGSPNLLVYSANSSAVVAQPSTRTVAFKSMVGSGMRTGGNWKASAAVTVRDVNSGATVASATVDATFSPGGNARCVTGSNGSCTLTSASLKSNTAQSTTVTGTQVTGTLMNYDATQNAVTQIVISKP